MQAAPAAKCAAHHTKGGRERKQRRPPAHSHLRAVPLALWPRLVPVAAGVHRRVHVQLRARGGGRVLSWFAFTRAPSAGPPLQARAAAIMHKQPHARAAASPRSSASPPCARRTTPHSGSPGAGGGVFVCVVGVCVVGVCAGGRGCGRAAWGAALAGSCSGCAPLRRLPHPHPHPQRTLMLLSESSMT